MVNAIEALNAKKQRLLAWKQNLKADYERTVQTIDEQIANIDKAASIVNTAVQDILCPRCKGEGTIRCPDAAGQMGNYPCPVCKGTGFLLDNLDHVDKAPKFWCNEQMIDENGKIICTAHLVEGCCSICPWKDNDERERAEYPCSDYRPRYE